MKNRVIYVPLDERSCNYDFPWELGLAAGLDVLRPPAALMSGGKRPCDTDALWAWLEGNATGCTHAVLSLDMLVYGCLIHSRRHMLAAEECVSRLNRLARLKALNPALEVHAFCLVMRASCSNSSAEEPDYWADYGMRIWKYSWLSDKKSRVGLDPDGEDELNDLESDIPQDILSDYLNRRRVNLSVNLEAVRLVKAGVIDRLVIPKDDNAEYGLPMRDSGEVCKSVADAGVRSRVFVYPGADEVGCTLMCRVLNRVNGHVPKIHVSYSSTLGPDIVAKYEDRPIHESVKWQVLSSGAIMAEEARDADIVLMVNTPGKYMLECADQRRRDHTYANFRNLEEFTQRLMHHIAAGRRCAVADVAYSNGADNELMDILSGERLLDKIVAYGGWNTCANTLGVVIFQATAAMALGLPSIAGNPALTAFHLRKLAEDWAYQANVLIGFYERAQELDVDCGNLGDARGRVGAEIVRELNAFCRGRLPAGPDGADVRIGDVGFPWDRLFDIVIRLE